MADNPNLYPASPGNVPAAVTKVTPGFKKEVSGVMGSILIFLAVYLLMLALSVGLIVACFYGGIAIIAAIANFFSILLGLGLFGLGIMVFVFQVKFLFAVTRHDNSNSIEITETDQPELYAFIRRLTRDVQAPFPKKIFLSPDVNAAVFYDSSFWSMFLPIRKNLKIGLGLVNSLNISEFKAVMAHEFGHFSQRSMKLGSFVYNVNRIIHNMLFENTGYVGLLNSWGSVHGLFAVFAQVTAKIAQSIQWVLRQMYALINRSYMRLSREMEFHADAVAASVSGSESLASALNRIELASEGYNITLQQCEQLFKEKKVSDNIYRNQTAVLKHLAGDFGLALENGLPVMTEKYLKENNSSRVNFKDQWASHPATNDRVKHLRDLGVDAEIINESAWRLFDHPEKLQSDLTRKLYHQAVKDEQVTLVGNEEFEEKLFAELTQFSVPEMYKGFYDNRRIDKINLAEIMNDTGPSKTFDEIFSPENVALQKKINWASHDIEILKAIKENRIRSKTFDFDGMKHKSSDAGDVLTELESERETAERSLKELDKEAVRFFLGVSRAKGEEEFNRLKDEYNSYFENRDKADEFLADINKMLTLLQPVFTGHAIPIENINVMIDDLKADHEPKFKRSLQEWLTLGAFDHSVTEKSLAEEFLGTKHSYFNGSSFLDRQLVLLRDTINESWDSVNKFLFLQFKSILEEQVKLLQ